MMANAPPFPTLPEATLPQGGAPPNGAPEISDEAWSEVLSAVDRTYAELVAHQERLEQQNRELDRLRQFLASVFASVSDVLVVLDRAGRIAEANASLAQMLGRAAGDLIGQDLAGLLAEADRPALARLCDSMARDRRPALLDLSLLTPAGPTPVEAVLSPRLDERGRLEGIVLTGRPVGELRQAYAQLEQSHAEMKAAQAQLVRGEKLASLGRLLAGVAHELNNPISFVYANAHALERYAGKFETYFDRVQAGADRAELVALREELRLDRELRNLREAVRGARDGAERVRDIVADLRRLSSEGTGDMVALDLAETARIAAHWVLRGAHADLALRQGGLASLMVRARPGHIQQVVMNLVQNAADALAARPADLAAQAPAQITLWLDQAQGMGRLSVFDNGPGVDPALAQAIFDPFFTTKPVGQGTGLGLSISHKIAEEHGGALVLVAAEAPGGWGPQCPPPAPAGACFRLELPLAEASAATAAPPQPLPRGPA